MPGLAEGLVPQGMDVWEEKELLLIVGHFKSVKNTSGSPSSSMIVTLDLKTGKLVGKYCIKNESGAYNAIRFCGIGVTEKNIFIADGARLARIPLLQIESLGEAGALQIVEEIKVPVYATWCNYFDGVLWVGEYGANAYPTPEWRHMTNDKGVTYRNGGIGYKVRDTESEFSSENWDPKTMSVATPDYYLARPDKIQGFTFVGDQIVLSQSESTDKNAQILVYDNVLRNEPDRSVTLNGKSVPVWFLDNDALVKNYTVMPMSEGITSYNDKLLLLFGSAATYYRETGRTFPTDRVWRMALPA